MRSNLLRRYEPPRRHGAANDNGGLAGCREVGPLSSGILAVARPTEEPITLTVLARGAVMISGSTSFPTVSDHVARPG